MASQPLASKYLIQKQKLLDGAVFFLLALGAFFRIAQYLAATSLWGDELSIVRNVSSKDLVTLLSKPLSDEQVAPAGFLVLVKLEVALAGMSEYSLRFVALLSSLFALPVFASLARKFFSRGALLLALVVFSTSIPLIRYAGQVKPYSLDVLASLISLLVAYSWIETNSKRTTLVAAATGATVIWFSYPSVFVLAAIGLFALWHCRTNSAASAKHVALVLATWLVAFAAFATLEKQRISPYTRWYMHLFWADWMLPKAPTLSLIRVWLVRLTHDLLADFLHLPKWPVMCVVLLIGACYLLRRTSSAILLLLPIVITFLASVLDVYPFRGRIILFLIPNLLLLLAAGILALTRAAGQLRVPLWGQYAILLAAALAVGARPLLNHPPPYRDSETKAILSYLGAHRLGGDGIYVDNMAWHALEFYGPQFSLSMEQAKISSLKGNAMRVPDPLIILKDLDTFRGRKRLWVVFGGAFGDQLTAPIWYLDTIGRRLDCRSAYNASVYLYDLSDPERLTSAMATDFFAEARRMNACADELSR